MIGPTLLLAIKRKLERHENNLSKNRRNIQRILFPTKPFSRWLPKLRGLCAALIDFFLQQCPGDGAEKMRSGSEVYVLPQSGGNVSRGFSRPFIVNVLPLDGLKVSVFLAVGGELNMKGISKWAGRLQTSA